MESRNNAGDKNNRRPKGNLGGLLGFSGALQASSEFGAWVWLEPD
jgi:hypothetical protein